MPYCPRCGKEVSEDERFCPSCGVDLKAERVPTGPRMAEKLEKAEKEEKREKSEKGEKREKEEVSPVIPLAGGLILVFIGITSFLATSGFILWREVWPYVLLFLGVIIVIAAAYAGITASRRSPRP